LNSLTEGKVAGIRGGAPRPRRTNGTAINGSEEGPTSRHGAIDAGGPPDGRP
jgi:hypothetical protein